MSKSESKPQEEIGEYKEQDKIIYTMGRSNIRRRKSQAELLRLQVVREIGFESHLIICPLETAMQCLSLIHSNLYIPKVVVDST